jgi:prepilin-type N-terminal cleavage/methylation domain-containing protein
MKFPVSNFQFPIFRNERKWASLRRLSIGNRQSAIVNRQSVARTPHSALRTCAGFTLMEIAICLAIIGFALVAIIGVLPYGMNTQRDVREETVINQDATVLLEAIRKGAAGADYLTNYVYAITNYWVLYDPANSTATPGVNGYTYGGATINGTPQIGSSLTNGANIIGVLSTPEYTDGSGVPIPSLTFGGISNHVVAYVRSISGPAAEKPPQDNPIMREDTLTYRLLAVNAPMPMDTNMINQMIWRSSLAYAPGSQVFWPPTYPLLCWQWQSSANSSSGDVPGQSANWIAVHSYPMELAFNQRELRLTFLWPQLPNGNVGNGRQTYRTTVAGLLFPQAGPSGQPLYFYQPQIFYTAP